MGALTIIKSMRVQELEEEKEAIHKFLDNKNVPRRDNVAEFSIIHRITLLEKIHLRSLSEIENFYLRKPLVD